MARRHDVSARELSRLELLQCVAPESVEGILDACTVRELEPGEVLLEVEQANTCLFLILSGCVRVHLASPENEPTAVLGRGEIVGELSLIDHGGASALVVADAPTRLLVMEEELLWSLVQVSHAASCNLLSILTRRLRAANLIISEGIHLEHDLQRYGTIDALTGLHNRYWLSKILPRQLSRVKIAGGTLSLAMIDIDYFKAFNDRHGHLAGDRAIHAIGAILIDHLRPTETAARYGGDEFVVLLQDLDLGKARIAAERLRRTAMETPVILTDGSELPPLTLSIGLAEATPTDAPDDLVSRADRALYRAKSMGRNSISG